jgi:hypothetical protein
MSTDGSVEERCEGEPSPDPGKMALPVATVVAIATERFGHTDTHDIEVAFDTLVIDLGGTRHDEPPYYGIPLPALGFM